MEFHGEKNIMLAFCGEERCTIDANGRLKLPLQFIDSFLEQDKSGEIILHCLDEGALALYGVATFKEMRYRELQQQDRIANSLLMRRNLRRFGAMSCSETISRQGRITLPESYRKRCELANSSSVVVVGIEIGVEIWNAERWEKELEAISSYEKLRAEAEINSSIERRPLL